MTESSSGRSLPGPRSAQSRYELSAAAEAEVSETMERATRRLMEFAIEDARLRSTTHIDAATVERAASRAFLPPSGLQRYLDLLLGLEGTIGGALLALISTMYLQKRDTLLLTFLAVGFVTVGVAIHRAYRGKS